jgi:hypothetical protein
MRRYFSICLWILSFLLLSISFPLLAQDTTETPTATATVTTEVIPTVEVATTEPPVVEVTTTTLPSDTPVAEQTAESTEFLLPTAAITAEVTAEQTEAVIPTAIDTATEPAPLLPEPVLAPVLSEAFHTGDLSQWNVGTGWGLLAQEQGFALQVTNSDAPVVSNVAHYDDVAVEMLVQTQTGTLNLHLRQTETDGYTLFVNPNGQVDLYHGEQLLATTNVTPTLPDQWRHVRFSVMGDTLRVTIDAVEVIALRDTTPVLTAGAIFFNVTFPEQPGNSGQQFNTLLVDNIRFWIPESDAVLTPTLTASPTLWTTPSPTALPLPEDDQTFIVIQPEISETLLPGWFFIDVDWTWDSDVTYNAGGLRSQIYTYTNPPGATLHAIQMTFTPTSGSAWGTWGIGNAETSLMQWDQISDQFNGTVCGGDVIVAGTGTGGASGCVQNNITPLAVIQMYDTMRNPATEWTFSFLVRSSQGHNGSGRFSNVRLLYYGTPPDPTPTPTVTATPQFNVIVVDAPSGGELQSMQSVEGVGTASVDPRLTDNGICSINEAIYKANSLSGDGINPFPDCDPEENDENYGTNIIIVQVPSVLHVFTEPDQLDPIRGHVVIRTSPLASPATITRSNTSSDFRLFTVLENGILELDNIIVSNGRAVDGGGIWNAGTLTLSNSVVIDNYASVNGGGIYNAGNLTLENNSAVERNRSEGDGGGIYNAGTLTVQDSRIQRNIGVDGAGGGIFSTINQSVNVANSCIVFNTAREVGGIYSVTPSLTNVNNNWWGDVRGPSDWSRPDRVNDRDYFIGKGDEVSGGTLYNIGNWQSVPPNGLCIDYSALFFDNPDGVVGQPGLAGEVYVRARQILDREPTFEEIFAFVLYDAGWNLLDSGVEQTRLMEAVARVYYNQTFRSDFVKERCATRYSRAMEMQNQEQIAPLISNPSPNHTISNTLPFILCGLGVTEWYGEDIWADDHAYAFVDFIRSNSYSQEIQNAALLITSDAATRVAAGIDPFCSVWEQGDATVTAGRSKPCAFKWGNYSIFPQQAQNRMVNEYNQVSIDDTSDYSIYYTMDFYNVVGGVESGLQLRFIVNGQEVSSGFVDSHFFILNLDQWDVLTCGSTDNRRLWIVDANNDYPICSNSRPGNAVDVIANN